MPNPRILLLSSSKVYGQESYEWCFNDIIQFFKKSNVNKLLFIPYACHDYDKYIERTMAACAKLGLQIESIHTKPDPVAAVYESEAILIGGGNTFLLLKTLYEKNLIKPIREQVLNKGVPIMGASAGSNVQTRSINTTNDMPICYPPSFDALNLVPFNINPHYIDADPDSKHMGETRETRIKEFLEEPDAHPVLGLREGSGVLVEDGNATLFGCKAARLFQKAKDPVEYEPGSDLTFLLKI